MEKDDTGILAAEAQTQRKGEEGPEGSYRVESGNAKRKRNPSTGVTGPTG